MPPARQGLWRDPRTGQVHGPVVFYRVRPKILLFDACVVLNFTTCSADAATDSDADSDASAVFAAAANAASAASAVADADADADTKR